MVAGDINNNPTILQCGNFRTVNVLETLDPNFPDVMGIESNITFVVNDTSLSGNNNILCKVPFQDPEVNVTLSLYGKLAICTVLCVKHAGN